MHAKPIVADEGRPPARLPLAIPAWLSSLALHLLILLILALLVRAHNLPSTVDEAQSTSTAMAPIRVQLSPPYFSDDQNAFGAPLTHAVSGIARSTEGGGVESPLHSDLPPPSSGIELPRGVGPLVDVGPFVGTSASGSGRGK